MRLSAFGGRFGLKFGCLRDSPARFCGRSPPIMPIDSVCWYGDGRFGVALWCGPSFLGGLFCGLPPGCCGGRFVCLGACGCRCCWGGLLLWLCAAEGNAIAALSPRASSPPPNWSRSFIAPYICGLCCCPPSSACTGCGNSVSGSKFEILQHRNVFLRNLRLVLGGRAHPNRRQHQH